MLALSSSHSPSSKPSSKQSLKVLTSISFLLLYFALLVATHTLTSINISHTLYLPFQDLCLNLCFLPSANESHLASLSFCFLCFYFTVARRCFTFIFVSDLFWFRSWARSLTFSVFNVIKKLFASTLLLMILYMILNEIFKSSLESKMSLLQKAFFTTLLSHRSIKNRLRKNTVAFL